MTITTRSGKGSALTHTEMDANLTTFNQKTSGIFDSVVDMVADDGLALDSKINTSSYYGGWAATVRGPIGGASYTVVTKAEHDIVRGYSTVDEAADHTLTTGDVALLTINGAIDVTQVGAKGDKVTDDLPAFVATYELAESSSGSAPIYIPGLPNQNYYKLSDAWVITRQGISIIGDGNSSCLVIHNALGANCITVGFGAFHTQIRDIAIMGIVGSGNGIEILGASHYGRYSDIYIGYVDGTGLKVTSGQSGVFKNIEVDENIGYAPVTVSGATRGNCSIGIEVVYHSGGNTNNQSFTNCKINGIGVVGSGNYSLKVGDSVNPVGITTFSWVGGVIQGSANNELIYVKADEAAISQLHLESTTTATEYVLTVDGCRNFSFKSSFCLGDINLTGTNRFAKLSDLSGVGGIDIASTTYTSRLEDISYKNNATGPTGGKVNDASNDTEFKNVTSITGVAKAIPGRQCGQNANLYFGTNFENWLGGASPTLPCGFGDFGGTHTRDAVTVRTGTYSLKTVYSATDTQGIKMTILPANMVKERKISIEAWVYVTTGEARIRGLISGIGTTENSSGTTGAWERLTTTFYPSSSDTSFAFSLTADTGSTVYWDSVNIYMDDLDPIEWQEETGLTVSLSNGGNQGYPVPVIYASGTTTVTGFDGQHTGIPFTMYFDGIRTVQNSATVQLAGGVNFVSSADDTLTLVFCEDGVFREISRSVN